VFVAVYFIRRWSWNTQYERNARASGGVCRVRWRRRVGFEFAGGEFLAKIVEARAKKIEAAERTS